MFKFLRKYNKWILAVGGGLLMIVFLVGDTLPRLTGGAGAAGVRHATVGIDGREKISAREWGRFVAEADIIRSLESRGQPVLPALGPIEGTEHWFLLVREARAAGLISPADSLNLTDQQLLQIGARAPSADVTRSAFANLLGIERMLDLYQNAGEVSDRRLREFASRVLHAVEAEIAVISAPPAEHAQITDAQLLAHFEEFKDFPDGEGPMGLGYRLPNRVKLEWLTVRADDVREAIALSDAMDGVSLRQHWRLNPNGTFPAVVPGDPVPNVVRNDLLNKLTDERLAEIASFLSGQLSGLRRGLAQDDGYFILPDDWQQQRLALPQLARNVQDRYGVPLPSYESRGDQWLSINELADIPGIGNASTDRFGAPVKRLRDLVSAIREFGGSMTMNVQAGVAGPPLEDREGNVYVFRVLDADPARQPRALDEVREQVVKGLRRIAGYEELVAHTSGIEQTARERGLVAVAVEHDAEIARTLVTLANPQMLQIQAQLGQALRPTPTELPGLGAHRPTVEAIIDRALALPEDVPLSELPATERTFVLPVEDRLSLVVVRIADQQPLTRELYGELVASGIVQSLLTSEELDGNAHLRQAFSLATLTKRHNLHVVRRADGEGEEEPLDG